jgi:hypothetical protein
MDDETWLPRKVRGRNKAQLIFRASHTYLTRKRVVIRREQLSGDSIKPIPGRLNDQQLAPPLSARADSLTAAKADDWPPLRPRSPDHPESCLTGLFPNADVFGADHQPLRLSSSEGQDTVRRRPSYHRLPLIFNLAFTEPTLQAVTRTWLTVLHLAKGPSYRDSMKDSTWASHLPLLDSELSSVNSHSVKHTTKVEN